MTIDEAIRIKSLEGDEFLRADPDDIEEADRLSLEALKAWKWMREHSGMSFDYYLPGETKD